MFNDKDLEAGFFVITLLGSLIIAWPVIQTYMPSIPEESYTELFILGSTHEAEKYPYEIQAGERYGLYLVVVNHRGASAYYQLQMKTRSIDDPPPNPMEDVPSDLTAIMEFPIILSDEGEWEEAITFSFPEIVQIDDTILIPEIILDENRFKINKTLEWDEEKDFRLGLFFELWIFDEEALGFQYDNRFVELWLYVTQPT